MLNCNHIEMQFYSIVMTNIFLETTFEVVFKNAKSTIVTIKLDDNLQKCE